MFQDYRWHAVDQAEHLEAQGGGAALRNMARCNVEGLRRRLPDIHFLDPVK
ncbi:Uncharacterised protein [Mycobacterium tuberculosis]|nr:Uncharacterised protein [Mycobacterium tuberculosis]COZ14517.1 Uncharacterised protein [Mycobacterium tuberculosis]